MAGPREGCDRPGDCDKIEPNDPENTVTNSTQARIAGVKPVLIIAVLLAIFECHVFAKSQVNPTKMERTGGDYTVAGISTHCRGQGQSGCFRIVFDAVHKTGRFDQLVLESNHVNVGVKPGDRIRLSAEVAVDRGRTAEVSQVVLFEGEPGSHVPVWMLSSKYRAGTGPAARYLEMHSPQTDFLVL